MKKSKMEIDESNFEKRADNMVAKQKESSIFLKRKIYDLLPSVIDKEHLRKYIHGNKKNNLIWLHHRNSTENTLEIHPGEDYFNLINNYIISHQDDDLDVEVIENKQPELDLVLA